MSDTNDIQALVMAVGEMRGQTRELVHATNNNTQALNMMGTQLAKLERIPAELVELRTRVTALEVSEHKRAGAMGLGGWLLRSPFALAIIAALAAAWAILKEKFS